MYRVVLTEKFPHFSTRIDLRQLKKLHMTHPASYTSHCMPPSLRAPPSKPIILTHFYQNKPFTSLSFVQKSNSKMFYLSCAFQCSVRS